MSGKHLVTGAVALAMGVVIGLTGTAWTQGRHPHITAAQRDLAAAEKQLSEAVHHYGGHRAKALELTKQARTELKEALEYARAHPGEFK
jgi:uncharacterized membrane-anchored protein YhcB (DUF1043 family)